MGVSPTRNKLCFRNNNLHSLKFTSEVNFQSVTPTFRIHYEIFKLENFLSIFILHANIFPLLFRSNSGCKGQCYEDSFIQETKKLCLKTLPVHENLHQNNPSLRNSHLLNHHQKSLLSQHQKQPRFTRALAPASQ